MSDVVLSPEAQRLHEQLRNGVGMLPASAPVEKYEELPARSRSSKPHVRKPESVGRFKTMNEFVDFSARLVDTTAQAVWLVLFRETKPNGLASVSQGQIADCIGLTRRTVLRAVQHLEAKLLVTVVRRGKKNGGPSVYRVHCTPKGNSRCDAGDTPTYDTNDTPGVTKRVKT